MKERQNVIFLSHLFLFFNKKMMDWMLFHNHLLFSKFCSLVLTHTSISTHDHPYTQKNINNLIITFDQFFKKKTIGLFSKSP